MHNDNGMVRPSEVTPRSKAPRRQSQRRLLNVLLVTAPLLVSMPAGAQTADRQTNSERWIATWAAPQVARLDQPPQLLPASTQAFPWVRDVPQAVSDVAPGQELPVGGMSPLPIKGQTLRQIAHVSLGGARGAMRQSG